MPSVVYEASKRNFGMAHQPGRVVRATVAADGETQMNDEGPAGQAGPFRHIF
jgi:hypothetical protein